MSLFRLFNEKEILSLREYHYKGSDVSLTLKYLLTPLYNHVHSYFPSYLAPNLITLVGFLIIFSAHLVIAYHSPRMDSDLPPWVSLYGGCALLLYQMFDNLDGKQARLTKTSSPLGHFFDHACDALNVLITGMNLCSVLKCGDGITAFAIIWGGGFLPFWFATWAEYHIGAMNLWYFNGPVEGLIIISAIHLYSALSHDGQHQWSDKYFDLPSTSSPFGINAVIHGYHLVGLSAFMAAILTVSKDIAAVIDHQLKTKQSVIAAFADLIPFLIFTVASALLIHNYDMKKNNHYYDTDIRLIYILIGLSFAHMVFRVIIAHLVHTKVTIISQIFYILSPLIILSYLSASSSFHVDVKEVRNFQHRHGDFQQPWEDTSFPYSISLILYVALIFVVVNISYYVIRVFDEICDALGIRVFVIVEKFQKHVN